MTPTTAPADADPLLPFEQCAQIVGVEYETFRRWAQRREFPVVDLGHRTKRVRRSDLDAFIASRTSPARRAS